MRVSVCDLRTRYCGLRWAAGLTELRIGIVETSLSLVRRWSADRMELRSGIAETRLRLDHRLLEEVGADYTFFWSGRPKAERRDAGVALAIRNDIVGRLPCLPQGINERLMCLRLPLRAAPTAVPSSLRRHKYYSDGLCTSEASSAAIARLPQVETNVDLDLPPTLHETIRAEQQLSSGKVPGSNAIPAEIYKHGGIQLTDNLTALFQEMWHRGEYPQDSKDTTIVHLYKRKKPPALRQSSGHLLAEYRRENLCSPPSSTV
ncbi:hypothetical protein SprV_0200960000 [Sparganum proliferum]